MKNIIIVFRTGQTIRSKIDMAQYTEEELIRMANDDSPGVILCKETSVIVNMEVVTIVNLAGVRYIRIY